MESVDILKLIQVSWIGLPIRIIGGNEFDHEVAKVLIILPNIDIIYAWYCETKGRILMNLQELLSKVITESNLLRNEFIEEVEEEVDLKHEMPEDEQEFRKLVMDYMANHGITLSQANYDYVADQLKNNQDDKGGLHETVTRTKQINNLEEYSLEELKDVLQICLLKQCEKLEKQLKQQVNGRYEYAVESVVDNGGATNVRRMSELINSYARQGWHVKTIFTNELGHNATSVSVGMVGSGTNYTVDEVVIVFEKCVKN